MTATLDDMAMKKESPPESAELQAAQSLPDPPPRYDQPRAAQRRGGTDAPEHPNPRLDTKGIRSGSLWPSQLARRGRLETTASFERHTTGASGGWVSLSCERRGSDDRRRDGSRDRGRRSAGGRRRTARGRGPELGVGRLSRGARLSPAPARGARSVRGCWSPVASRRRRRRRSATRFACSSTALVLW